MPIEETLCPLCDARMVRRTSARGPFWGCSKYPRCRGTRNSSGEAPRHIQREPEPDRDHDPDVCPACGVESEKLERGKTEREQAERTFRRKQPRLMQCVDCGHEWRQPVQR